QLIGRTPLAGGPTQVGDYTVLASFAGSADYTAAAAVANFTISPATLTVTVDSSLMLVNTHLPALKGTVGNIAFTGRSTYTTAQGDILKVALGTPALAARPVGIYPITASLSG